MLRKLMKHELRATGRVMLPLYLVVLVSSLAARLTSRAMLFGDSRLLHIFGGLIMFVFGASVLGVCLVTLVLMLRRFQQNLLGDEGYLMFTLPVSVSAHIWSKLLVSALWFFLTGIVVGLSAMWMALGTVDMLSLVPGLLDQLLFQLQLLPRELLVNSVVLALEGLVLLFLGACCFCLMCYGAMAVGYSFPGHKLAWSVGFWFLFQLGGQLLTSIAAPLAANALVGISTAAAPQLLLLLAMVGELLLGGVYYAITHYFLQKRLNLA